MMWIGYRSKHGSLKIISKGVISRETGEHWHWAAVPDHSSIFFHCTIKLVKFLTLCFFMPTWTHYHKNVFDNLGSILKTNLGTGASLL